MRRSSRNIETFDISLMAVVTKAMGAFLVIMLLLIPYYSSGPIGQQQAADLASQIEQINQKINEVMNRLVNASPEDLRKLLEDALRRLEEARRLLAELKRANDALQSQARRLEQQVASLQAEVQKLKEELNKLTGNSITAFTANLDCKEAVSLALYDGTPGAYRLANTVIRDVLNFDVSPARAVANNFSYVTSTGLKLGTQYHLVARVTSRDAKQETINGVGGVRLKRATSACFIQITLVVDWANGQRLTLPLSRLEIKQGEYAKIFASVTLSETSLESNKQPEAAAKWLADQIGNAAKED